MIKEFSDGSYIEFKMSDDLKDVIVSICSRNSDNLSIVTSQSVAIEKVEFSTLVKDLVKLPK
jgi:hypothetical protein